MPPLESIGASPLCCQLEKLYTNAYRPPPPPPIPLRVVLSFVPLSHHTVRFSADCFLDRNPSDTELECLREVNPWRPLPAERLFTVRKTGNTSPQLSPHCPTSNAHSAPLDCVARCWPSTSELFDSWIFCYCLFCAFRNFTVLSGFWPVRHGQHLQLPETEQLGSRRSAILHSLYHVSFYPNPQLIAPAWPLRTCHQARFPPTAWSTRSPRPPHPKPIRPHCDMPLLTTSTSPWLPPIRLLLRDERSKRT